MDSELFTVYGGQSLFTDYPVKTLVDRDVMGAGLWIDKDIPRFPAFDNAFQYFSRMLTKGEYLGSAAFYR